MLRLATCGTTDLQFGCAASPAVDDGDQKAMEFQKATTIEMRKNAEFNEAWLQQRLIDDPSLLGLGDVVVKDVEKRLAGAGRLDLLLADQESDTRYEVEIQLGATDPSHIIRTIEYWDIERRRYPQFDHVAVIVAENVTSRFLNVINLFNGFIPIVAIQIRCLALNGIATVVATRVVDRMVLGDDDDEGADEPTNRDYWVKKSSATSVGIAEAVFALVQELDPGLQLNYRKNYVGLARGGLVDNFMLLFPRKQNRVIVTFRTARSDEIDSALEDADLPFEYKARRSRYRLELTQAAVAEHQAVLRGLARRAHGQLEEGEAEYASG